MKFQEGILLPSDGDVATFVSMIIPKYAIDDSVVFLVVGQILDLVSPTNRLLIAYKASMDPTPTGILAKNATFKGAEEYSKEAKGTKKKNQATKPKSIDEEVFQKDVSKNSGKGALKRIKKTIPRKSTTFGSKKQLEKLYVKVTEEALIHEGEIPNQEGKNPIQEVSSIKPMKLQLKVTKRAVIKRGVSIPDSPGTKK